MFVCMCAFCFVLIKFGFLSFLSLSFSFFVVLFYFLRKGKNIKLGDKEVGKSWKEMREGKEYDQNILYREIKHFLNSPVL